MDKLTIISGCLFLAADIFAIASIANPDWINTGESAGALTVGLVRQCQTIHGRDRTCIPPRLPPEWVTTLFFIIMGIISLTVTCGLLVASHWRREATKYARWIAFTGKACLPRTHGPFFDSEQNKTNLPFLKGLIAPSGSKTGSRSQMWPISPSNCFRNK
ncbi:modulator of smoothened protein isoform X2 [Suricata suricatta]|uniref:modulator of smoothened protein isoform X2 n=1 Tax=Suricata suricatta TaxID=37032 RepID=UPI001155C47D|nr:modulator of smoothened protein isoform X2 [Suricata suricatta]